MRKINKKGEKKVIKVITCKPINLFFVVCEEVGTFAVIRFILLFHESFNGNWNNNNKKMCYRQVLMVMGHVLAEIFYYFAPSLAYKIKTHLKRFQ